MWSSAPSFHILIICVFGLCMYFDYFGYLDYLVNFGFYILIIYVFFV